MSRKLNVLVACECSGIVRDEFLKLGHYAISCDILPCDRPGEHHQGDVRELLEGNFWDLMIAHPPCTHLSVSGARWATDHWVKKQNHPEGGYWHDGSMKRLLQIEALEFVKALVNAPIPKICIENPVSIISSRIRKPDQWIQPWQFGHGETKKTGLWLKNLPNLTPTRIVKGREDRIHKMTPSEDRGKLRSITYTGIAKAFAKQWGGKVDE